MGLIHLKVRVSDGNSHVLQVDYAGLIDFAPPTAVFTLVYARRFSKIKAPNILSVLRI
jgi:hypothetical protein